MDGRQMAIDLAAIGAALVAATAAVAALESPVVGLPDASPVYFAAIVLVGSLIGTWPAIVTAVLAFVVYDLLFTVPRLTLVVNDPREWLDLVVFLVIAVVVGRLASLGTERATEASRRAAESTDLFAISRILATAADVGEAAPLVVRRLADAGGLERIWIVRDRPGSGGPQVIADTEAGAPLPTSPIVVSLVRTPGDAPAHWVRAHEPATPGGTPRRPGRPLVRVRMEADGVTIGALKATLGTDAREPDRSTTR